MSKFCMGCMEQFDDTTDVCPFCGYADNTPKENALHIDPGEIIRDRFIVGKAIGYGGFGVTYIGWDALLEHKVAIKEYMPSEFSTRALGTKQITVFGGKKAEQFSNGLNRFHDEARTLAKFNTDDGIVRVYDTFEENGTAYIIMELLYGKTLAEHLEKVKVIPYEEAIKIILPIANALKTVHESALLHRDIAPDNIFLTDDGKVKLIDFGAARFVTASQNSMSVLIKPGYSPEEQYRSHEEQGSYTDVYALGAVLYRMITGETPPDSMERRAFYEKNKKDLLIPISKLVKDIPENKQNAIYNAMNVRVEDRTQTMEVFIHELTSEEPVVLKNSWMKKRGSSLPLWAKCLIPVAAVLMIVVGVAVAGGMRGSNPVVSPTEEGFDIQDDMARVPSVLDQNLENAVMRLSEEFLLYNISGKEYSNDISSDLVLRQSIDGGAVVAKNTMIDLVISGGTEMVTIPDLEGMYADEAITLLSDIGIQYRIENEYSNMIAENCIISQSLSADSEQESGSEIILKVSMGRDPNQAYEEIMIEVPDFVGKDYQEVLEIAQEKQLLIIVKEKIYSDSVEKNIVMAQNVNAGSQIMSGTMIELTVSLGIQTLRVPDLEFRTEADAIAQLERLGLKPDIIYETSDIVKAGVVISYSPANGATVSAGDTVRLVVSKGGSAFAMPDVTKMSEAEAKQILYGKSLTVHVNYEYSSTAAGIVLSQDTAAGTSVYAGNLITLTVSTGEQLYSIPDVSNKTEKDAVAMLEAQGFVVLNVTKVYDDKVKEDLVITQIPAAGSMQKKGASVMLTVSKGPEIITILPTGIAFSNTDFASSGSAKMNPGDTYQLNAVVSPANATDKRVTWTSSNPAVVSVDSNGNIQAVGQGEATITATTASGGKSVSLRVTVKDAQMYLNTSFVDLNPTQTYDLLYYASENENAIEWSVSDSSVISCTRSSSTANAMRITPHKVGEADITARLVIGGKTYTKTCRVVVHLAPEAVIDEESVTLKEGEKHKLGYSYGGSNVVRYHAVTQGAGGTETTTEHTYNVDDTSILFKSSDENIVRVDYDGGLTAVGKGTATITFTVNGASDTCLVTVIKEVEVLSGNIGTNLSWKVEGSTLTISGTGRMEQVSYPWASMSEIKNVVIEDGVESIAPRAFYGCTTRTVSLPSSLTEIGEYAFAECTHLGSVELSYACTSVGKGAFNNCRGMESIKFYNSECNIFDDISTISGAGIMIYGYSLSTAQTYAEKYGLNFTMLRRVGGMN